MTTTERFEFQGANGQTLVGRLERPSGPARATAVFAHCFACTKASNAAVRVSRRLAGRGFAVLRFDFTGLGESEEDSGPASLAADAADIGAACAALAARGLPPGLLVGHSLGGAAAVLAASGIESVKAVSTIGAPVEPGHSVVQGHPAEAHLGGAAFPVSDPLIRSMAAGEIERAAANLRKPLLIFHAPGDAVVGIDQATRLFKAARHPKSFVSLDGANHLLGSPQDAGFVGDVVAAWAMRYLDAVADDATEGPVAAPGEVVVEETGEGPYAQAISISGRHRLRADEPTDHGGGDRGPNPYDLLQSALGACKSMTVRMYADRKGWPLTGVRVSIRHRKVAVEGGAKADRFLAELSFTGALDAEQRARLIEISERCPVHRTLTGEVQIESRAASGGGGGSGPEAPG